MLGLVDITMLTLKLNEKEHASASGSANQRRRHVLLQRKDLKKGNNYQLRRNKDTDGF